MPQFNPNHYDNALNAFTAFAVNNYGADAKRIVVKDHVSKITIAYATDVAANQTRKFFESSDDELTLTKEPKIVKGQPRSTKDVIGVYAVGLQVDLGPDLVAEAQLGDAMRILSVIGDGQLRAKISGYERLDIHAARCMVATPGIVNATELAAGSAAMIARGQMDRGPELMVLPGLLELEPGASHEVELMFDGSRFDNTPNALGANFDVKLIQHIFWAQIP